MSRILAAVLASYLLLASTPASGDALLLASASSFSLPTQADFSTSSSQQIAHESASQDEHAADPAVPNSDSEAFLRHAGYSLTQSTLRAFTSVEDWFGLFAGGKRLRLGHRGSVLDIEGGAALRLSPHLQLTGGYKALGYGTGSLDPQMGFAFFGVDVRY